MRNRLFLMLLVIVSLSRVHVRADEGMWLPFLVDDVLYADMKEMGLNLTRDEIFSFTNSSLKDAIVHFGGGCTAEIISDQGLVLTNHHCGYSRIQAHSSVENDLLTNGFWAERLEDELPNPGLFVRFLVQAEDVTARVLEEVTSAMDEQQRNALIRSKISQIVEEATRDNHYSANVRPMFAGNEYFLFVYETYTDVRLVGTPPESIGAYGGDTDNWMWPRHTGDFSLFRVYTAPDGRPAAYHIDNIPLKPRHYLPISVEGVRENDFAMILGYPGSTNRYLTSYGIEYNLEQMYPVRIDIRRRKLDVMEKAMASSDEIRIKYASKQSGIANYWKNFIGMSRSLKSLDVAETKRALEAEFESWISQHEARRSEYGDVLESFRKAYEDYRGFHSHHYVFIEAMSTGPDILRVANSYNSLLAALKEGSSREDLQESIESLRSSAGRSYRNYDQDVDQQIWAAMFKAYADYVPAADLPGIFQTIEKKYKGDFDRYAADVYSRSIFANQQQLEKFLDKPSARKLEKDPAFQAARSVYLTYNQVSSDIQGVRARVDIAERLFLKGLREMKPDVPFYPDANGTMRFTYGRVGGYHPADAVYYEYYTTLDGVMEKENPNHHEFVVPDQLKTLYQSKDYGMYATGEGQMVVNFIADLDITGGNSGSPVINGDGHLIGLAFDGNWEAMSGDILFEDEVQRCINVDARYILFVIEKFAGATRIMNEITIIDGK